MDPTINIKGSSMRVTGEDHLRFARPSEIGLDVKRFYCSLTPSEMSYDFLYTPPTGTLDIQNPDIQIPLSKQAISSVTDIQKKDIQIPLNKQVTGAASEGTFVQLLSRGPQDVYLTYVPEMSFFKRIYKRYTNFAIEHSEEKFSTTVRFGTKNTISLSKRGDLVGSMILRVVLPNLNITGGTWKQTIGYNILEKVILRIGDTIVQTTEGLWLDIDDKLFCPDSKLAGLNKLVRRDEILATNTSHELLIPLKFFCCKNSTNKQQFIPILNLQTNINVYVDFNLKPLSSLVNIPTTSQIPDSVSLNAGLITEYIFLDDSEKFRFAQSATNLMIDMVYSIDKNTFLTTTNGQIVNQSKIDIELRELNKPVKYFAIVAYPENDFSGFEYSNIFEKGTFYINNDQQFNSRSSEYFTLIQTYQHGKRCNSTDNILLFSFSLDALAYQPNGSLNFSPFTKTKFSFDIIPQTDAKQIKLFAVCVNFIIFENGLARMLFI